MTPDVSGGPFLQNECMTNTPALRRDRHDARIGGVCAALARSWGVDLKLVRIGTIILTVITSGLAIAGYFALWLLIPPVGSDKIPVRRWLPFTRNWTDTQLVVVVVSLSIVFAALMTGVAPGGLVVIGIVTLIIASGMHRPKQQPTTAPAPLVRHVEPPRTEFELAARAWENRMSVVYTGVPLHLMPTAAPSVPAKPSGSSGKVWFSVVAGFGAVWGVLYYIGLRNAPVPALAYASGFLAVLGLALLSSVRRPKRPFGLASAAIMTGLVTAFMLPNAQMIDRVIPESSVLIVTSEAQLSDSMYLGSGRNSIDLSELELTEDLDVTYTADVGEITIVLPHDVNTTVHSFVDVGEIVHDGRSLKGIDREDTLTNETDPDAPLLEIEIHLDVGRIEVQK